MSLNEHVEALKSKHSHLEQEIDQENLRPHPDEGRITALKREKLRIKDQIAGIDHH